MGGGGGARPPRRSCTRLVPSQRRACVLPNCDDVVTSGHSRGTVTCPLPVSPPGVAGRSGALPRSAARSVSGALARRSSPVCLCFCAPPVSPVPTRPGGLSEQAAGPSPVVALLHHLATNKQLEPSSPTLTTCACAPRSR